MSKLHFGVKQLVACFGTNSILGHDVHFYNFEALILDGKFSFFDGLKAR
jgi:hypothetical protein